MATSFDRFAGVLVGAAVGDALGAGYEFGPSLSPDHLVEMHGQGLFAPGEWTDDTAQLLAIAMAAADGHDLSAPEGEDAVAANLQEWYLSPAREKDIGVHSSAVFGAVATQPQDGLADRFRDAAEAKEALSPGRSGGNGALMRTAAVALALHEDPERMVRAAMRLASMTHADDRSSEACAVWCLAIRAALMGPPAWDADRIDDLGNGLLKDIHRYLGSDAWDFWRDALKRAHRRQPTDFHGVHSSNGYSVTALQAAWAAISGTPVPDSDPAAHLRRALEAAVRGGGDTDTVACIAGALLGAMWGYSAVSLDWRRRVFGWPGYRDADLLRVAAAIRDGGVDSTAWPHAEHVAYDGYPNTDSLAVHPHDDGVILSGVDAAYGRIPLPGGPVDAVVSLCRVGTRDLDPLTIGTGNHVEVRLIDTGDPHDNPHLAHVMNDAADTIAVLRSEGKRVLVHCVAAQSRTPTIAALYAATHLGVDPQQALHDVRTALPAASPNPTLAAVALNATVRPL